MTLIPLIQIGEAAAPLALLVIVLVEMAKAMGLSGKRRKAMAAVVAGQALAWAHWAVAWQHAPTTGYDTFLCGLVASAMAMGLWQAALKHGLGK